MSMVTEVPECDFGIRAPVLHSSLSCRVPLKVQGSLSSFQQGNSAGERLMAIAVLNVFPDTNHLDWLAERMDPEQEQPFVSFHAAVPLLDAVTNSPVENCATLHAAVAKAKLLALRLKGDTGRVNVLQSAEQEFERRCRKANT
jgi:hypothetical protein